MTDLQTWLLPIFTFLIMIYMILYVRMQWRKNRLKNEQHKPFEPKEHDLLKMQDKENDFMLRMETKMREFGSQIDNKIVTLNVLIEEADKRINELKSVKGKPQALEGDVEPKGNKTLNNADIHQKVKQLQGAGMSAMEIAKHLKMLEGEVNLILSIHR